VSKAVRVNHANAPGTNRETLPTIWAATGVAAISLALYWSALGAGFVGDDFMILHRLRALGGPLDAVRFFRGEFFEYYRPLGFISHALDWTIAGQNARQFHLTNLLIHTVNAVVVLLIGRALSPRSYAGVAAALLFALHASNTEAVIWISARFDLLATCFGLAAVCWLVRGWKGAPWVPAVIFLPALLSKEAAVALPLAAAGWAVFVLGESTRATLIRVAPWIASLLAYSVLRHVAGGVSPVGGSSRIPKLVALAVSLAVIVALADRRWERLREWLQPRRRQGAYLAGALLAATLVAAAASQGYVGHLAREKFAVAGFEVLYLSSPVLSPVEALYSDPATGAAWLAGAVAVAFACGLVVVLWDRLLNDRRMWFLAAFLAATLLPISALTEGKRYLYLPSAAMSLMVGILIGELQSRSRRLALSVAAIVLVVSAIQITLKIRDWRWAGAMTAEGARIVDSALAPACGAGDVVFLTSPVGIRSVYSHFYYETFEVPRGCMPEVFQVVARVLRRDTRVSARWNGPGEIVMTAPSYHNNFILSGDLRAFNAPLRAGQPLTLQTPLGVLRAETAGAVAELTLALTPEAQRRRIHFFYYSDGEIKPLEARR
jgi:hypothetical protein